MILYIFNPEHDICMANGDKNFVPPRMALDFATSSYGVMRWLDSDPDQALCAAATSAAEMLLHHPDIHAIVPWGWDATLRHTLVRQGVDESMLPTLESVNTIRELSHRAYAFSLREELHSLLPDMPQAALLQSSIEAQSFLDQHHNIIMKAPWSGSGQGIRPVRDQFTPHDEGWIRNIIHRQRCVVAEYRCEVVTDFALEYLVGNTPRFVGYSLFESQGFAYQANWLFDDDVIRNHLAQFINLADLDRAKSCIETWLLCHVVGQYQGPVGIDMFVYRRPKCDIKSDHGLTHSDESPQETYSLNPLVELNFRYTMGFVAHEYLRHNPDQNRSRWDCRSQVNHTLST